MFNAFVTFAVKNFPQITGIFTEEFFIIFRYNGKIKDF